jgi:hypothetical protein
MRRFANAYLALFLADAALSVVDDQLAIWGGVTALSPLRQSLGLLTMVAGFAMFWALAGRPQLPRSVFLPPPLLTLWVVLGAMPLPVCLGIANDPGPTLSAAQLAVAVAVLLRVRALTGGSWLFGPETLPDVEFSMANALKFAIVSFAVAPVAFFGYVALSLSVALSVGTAGFLRVAPDGIYSQEREYRRGDEAVHLIGMVHVASSEFYREVLEGLPEEESVILIEGVVDSQALLESSFSYDGLASALNLAPQSDFGFSLESAGAVHADVDVSMFAPSTIALLNRVGSVLDHDSLPEILRAAIEFTQSPVAGGELAQVSEDLIGLRNRHALEVLFDSLDRHRVAILAWGALHMPGLEAGLKASGFELFAMRERRVIEF